MKQLLLKKQTILKTLWMFPVVFPFVFVLLFFGYLPPRYDVAFYTDNIVGEGFCSAYLCSPASFSPFYQVGSYFGSKLKSLTFQGFHYDVDAPVLTISDVSEVDILGYDVFAFGFPVAHRDGKAMNAPENTEGLEIHFSHTDNALHITFDNPAVGKTLRFDGVRFLPLWFWAAYWTLILLITAFLSLGAVYLTERFPIARLPLLCASAIVAVLLAGCFFNGSIPYVDYSDFLLNWMLLYAASLLINALTLPWLGTVLIMAAALFWYVANFFVISFRDKPVMPADLRAIRTAREVISGYTLTPTWQMLFGIAVSAAFAIAVILVSRRDRRQRVPIRAALSRRGLAAGASIALFFVSVHNPVFYQLDSFAWDALLLENFHREGMILTFLKSQLRTGVEQPEGYSREVTDAYLMEYIAESEADDPGGVDSEPDNPKSETPEPPSAPVRPTNIIMVMNEAFSDLRTVGMDGSIDVMPFIDSLTDNIIEGSLYVSVYGGGTCNSEFEALTGNSLAFFGAGAYPYTENITAPLFSLASYFQSIGYLTEAFHANAAYNWNRNMVYPYLGFDQFHPIDDYPAFTEETVLRDMPKDIADYLYMERVSAENSAVPRFLFNVTMQNHSGYERWLDLPEAETLKSEGETHSVGENFYRDTKIYLSLVRVSDEAVEQLVETYRDSDEPTMIVFFGDHQPGLPSVSRADVYTRDDLTFLDQFQSKFFIWTNYETEALHDVSISANYLPYLILKRGNFPLPPYIQLLGEIAGQYPVISSQGVIDADGMIYSGVGALSGDPLIQKYRCVQYANLFDELDPRWFSVD